LRASFNKSEVAAKKHLNLGVNDFLIILKFLGRQTEPVKADICFVWYTCVGGLYLVRSIL
jgi:hypothetical protein